MAVTLQEDRKLVEGQWVTADELYKKHYRFMWKIASKYKSLCQRLNIDIDDLFSLASIGFIKAYENFDDSKGFKFITYAGHMMTGEIFRYFRDQGHTVKFPRSVIELSNKISSAGMIESSNEEIAEHFEVDVETAQDAKDYRAHHQSLEQEVFQDGGNAITLGDQQSTHQDFSQINVDEFLDVLPDKLKKVAQGLLNNKTQNEIGKQIGVSQVQVSRLQKQLGEEYKRWESGEMAHEKLEEAKRLLADTHKKYTEIADITGVPYHSVASQGKRIRKTEHTTKRKGKTAQEYEDTIKSLREEISKLKQTPKTQTTQEKEKALDSDLQRKFNELSDKHSDVLTENNQLRKQLNDMSIDLEDEKNRKAVLGQELNQLEKTLSRCKNALRERNEDCDKQEEELSNLYTAYDKLKAWVQADMEVG